MSNCPQTDWDDVKSISQNSNHFRIKGNYYYSHCSTSVFTTVPSNVPRGTFNAWHFNFSSNPVYFLSLY